jgi:hypothetical protein
MSTESENQENMLYEFKMAKILKYITNIICIILVVIGFTKSGDNKKLMAVAGVELVFIMASIIGTLIMTLKLNNQTEKVY